MKAIKITDSANFFHFHQNHVHLLLPYSVMGGVSFIAAGLCMTLPETNNLPLEEVLQEFETETDKAGTEEVEMEGKYPLINGTKNNDAPQNEEDKQKKSNADGGQINEEKDKEKHLLINDADKPDDDNNTVAHSV